MPDIIIDKYCEIFRDCLEEELAITEAKAIPVITEITSAWTTRTLMFAFGDAAELSKIVESVFTHSDVRNFVYGLTMRFIIRISGNEDISFEKLVDILTSWCLSSDSLARAAKHSDVRLEPEAIISELSLIPKEIPTLTRNVLLGTNMNIGVTLEFNRFLIVPMMLNIGGLVSIPAPTATGKAG